MIKLLAVLLSISALSSISLAENKMSEISVEVKYCAANSGFGSGSLCANVYTSETQEMLVDFRGDEKLYNALASRILQTGISLAFVVSGKIVPRTIFPSRPVKVLVVTSIVDNPNGPRPRSAPRF